MKKISMILGSLSAFFGMYCSPIAAQNYDAPCGRLTLGGEWLFWQLEQTNMDIATIGNSTGTVVDESGHILVLDSVSSDIHPTPQYHSGYRLKLGYDMPGNGWELSAIYSYIPSHTIAW